MATRDELLTYCEERLRANVNDVAPNGLQVEGRVEVTKLAVAVSTSRYTLEEAVAWGADALLVHHGLFWGERAGPIAGIRRERLRLLLANDLNLIAYHLPLDAHPEIGNNALLTRALGYEPTARFAGFGGDPLAVVGVRDPGLSLDTLLASVEHVTERAPVVVGDIERVREYCRVGVLTGSGYGALADAARLGCEALVTGDVRESTMAEARELGIAVIVAGHEATERLGIQALASELVVAFGIETRFIGDPNPV